MIKSPAFTKIRDFMEWVKDNDLEHLLEVGPSSFPFITIATSGRKLAYVYLDDFEGGDKKIFEKFCQEHYPALWEMIEQPKIMKKAAMGPV